MFISSIKMKGCPGKRTEILQTIIGVSNKVKLEKGCLSVDSYQDINDENTFYIVGVWHTQRNLEDYLVSDLFAVLLGIGAILVETPEVKVLVEDCSYNCEGYENVQVH